MSSPAIERNFSSLAKEASENPAPHPTISNLLLEGMRSRRDMTGTSRAAWNAFRMKLSMYFFAQP